MQFSRKFFDPAEAGGQPLEDGSVLFVAGHRPEDIYIYAPKTILALNVALATRRPLLISGEPGSGKSSLARNAAAALGSVYYERVVTSRTQASDLLWTFDSLRRLNDATTRHRNVLPQQAYVEPGPLWWAFDPDSARTRGPDGATWHGASAPDPGILPTRPGPGNAVVLIDEIDKADPDVPNDLLEPFGAKSFTVRETGHPVHARRDVLLILTTNGERELPPAFLRRCVVLALEPPTRDWFVTVAIRRHGADGRPLYERVADEVMKLRDCARSARLREPGTAEFLDALDACRELEIDTASEAFAQVARTTLWKHERSPDRAGHDAWHT